MGKIFNMIISNDLLFYGIIVFLIVGVALLFMYLHHKKVINELENDIDFQKVDENNFNENLDEIATKVSYYGELDKEVEEKISELDGKMAMAKILDEEDIEPNYKKTNIVSDFANVKEELKDDIIEDKKNVDVVETKQEPKSELELVLEKMQHDLEEQKDQDAVALFEQEQEEKSIISYKELLQRKNELTSAEVLTDERFENEPTMMETKDETLTDNYMELVDNVNDIISVDSEINNDEVVEDETKKKFVTTDFISPVFGRRQANFDYPKVPNFKDMMIKKEKTNEYDLETTLNLDPLTDQIKRDDAFLSALKEFRKNLE